jgi:hypothetical protein
MWSGSAADHNVHAFAIGRDIDSGTRLTAFAETGLGALATVRQYEPIKNGALATTNGTGATGDGVAVDALTSLWPIQTINNITEGLGNGGYPSGGLVALVLANHTAAGQFMVSYVGVADAATAVTNGAKELTYNGVTFSASAVQEGDYTFWGYEHLYYSPAGVSGTKKQVADKLALQIFNTDAPLPHYNDMAVKRATDGSVVLPLF